MDKITRAQVAQAEARLQQYKRGKANLEQRIVQNQQWYKMRHTQTGKAGEEQPASAWLFNSLANKHADAMDNYPAPAVLPRSPEDEQTAQVLSAILPAILEENDYEQVYARKWWAKLKHGTGAEGVFWDPDKDGGLGDIRICAVDILNLFWEPGVQDIQESPHLYHVTLENNEALLDKYPQLEGKLGQRDNLLTRYLYDDTVDTSKKTVVTDWYYKTRGRLHYCRFAAGEVLYATENDPDLAERGLYDHGMYPFLLDVLFEDEGTPAGFGYLDIMKPAQSYIDRLDGVLLKTALMAGKKRFFIRTDGSVNEQEFADWSKDFVHVFGGGLGEDSIREIRVAPPAEAYIAALQRKVDELKEVSGNRDFSQGGTMGGVTAASAIAALQEAGSKLSRDMLKGSYVTFCRMGRMILELVRQFYWAPRQFRVTDANGARGFTEYVPAMLATPENMPTKLFDISVRAQKHSPFARISQNELAREFYQMGFFDPANAKAALACIDMMDFEGKAAVMERIRRGFIEAQGFHEARGFAETPDLTDASGFAEVQVRGVPGGHGSAKDALLRAVMEGAKMRRGE